MNQLTVLKVIAVIVTCIAWRRSGNLGMCWLFWLTTLSAEISMLKINRVSILIIIGTLCNATVTLLNNGIMPVVGMPVTMQAAFPVWEVAGTKHVALALADHSSMWYFSVGDFCLQAGAVVLVVNFLFLKRRKYVTQTVEAR